MGPDLAAPGRGSGRAGRRPAATIADRRTLLDEIAKLPRKQRTVLVLRYYEGMADAEIATTLGCAETTVRGYAFRALKTLRVELTPAAMEA